MCTKKVQIHGVSRRTLRHRANLLTGAACRRFSALVYVSALGLRHARPVKKQGGIIEWFPLTCARAVCLVCSHFSGAPVQKSSQPYRNNPCSVISIRMVSAASLSSAARLLEPCPSLNILTKVDALHKVSAARPHMSLLEGKSREGLLSLSRELPAWTPRRTSAA